MLNQLKSFLFTITVGIGLNSFAEGRLLAQETAPKSAFSVMSFNVENLFDTEDAPDRQDEDFLPEGRYQWTEEKLQLKMRQLATVITSVRNPDGSQCPDFLGMVEVENLSIAQRLNREVLGVCGYDKVIGDPRDPDPRGIRAVSLTRLPLIGRPVSHQPYPGARFIQEVWVETGDQKLGIFTNHWKSRRSDNGGDGEDRRRQYASLLRRRMEQILEQDSHAHFIAMGDFNDEPENKSIRQDLKSTPNLHDVKDRDELMFLWNPVSELLRLPAFRHTTDADDVRAKFKRVRSTYYYGREDQYTMLDHFHLSPGLHDEVGLEYVPASFQVYRHRIHSDQQLRPVRFKVVDDGEPRAIGVADHFPILLQVRLHSDAHQ